MEKPRRRLSLWRLLVVIAVAGGGTFFMYSQINAAYLRLTEPPVTTWFAPYVDTTLLPTFDFEDPLVSPARYSVLGFIVADPGAPCTPTWGTYFSLDGADHSLDLDRRIVRLRERGGDIVVSFGGAANQELSVACTNPTSLLNAYQQVLSQYGSHTIDFDIEGSALSDQAANERRAQAVRSLQALAHRRRQPLVVWLTLPVSTQGLTTAGLAVVKDMLSAKVNLGGVNVMTMDYGVGQTHGLSMGNAGIQALQSTFRQLKQTYRSFGLKLSDQQIWQHMGATPMIGQNDVSGETFTLADAQSLVAFARHVHLGRVSMWSANRDYPCGVNVDLGAASNICSGLNESPLAFAWEFARLNASMPGQVKAPKLSIGNRAASRDNPYTSPYPIWDPTQIYLDGDKVVWHGEVYESKWYTENNDPDQAVGHSWNSPWRDIGPVLPGDASRTGSVPQIGPWSNSQVYLAGNEVIYHRYIFKALWWTQGDTPQVAALRPHSTPWKIVGPVKTQHPGSAGITPVHGH